MFTNRDLYKLIIPLIIEQLLAVTVGMADVMMVATAGEAAVSGVSLVDMINVLIINIFAALATGGAVVCAQCIGRKQKNEAGEYAKQLLFIVSTISITISLLVLIFKEPLLQLVFGKIEAEVMKNALTYIIISALSYPFLALYNGSAALFRAIGNSKISMKISVLMNLLNIIGNAIFVFGFNMGVAGVALSSLFSRMLAACIMLILLNKPNELLYIESLWKIRPEGWRLKRILGIGIPNALENSMFQLGRVLVVSIISGFGTVQIAANAVANNLDALGCIPGQAMSLAMITVVGQCVGAGDYKAVKDYTKKLLKMTYAFTILVNASILIGLPFILSIYKLSPETLKLATILVLIHDGCAMLMWPAAFTLPNALRAANDVKFTMVVSIFSMWTFRILFSVLLGKGMGLGAIGVWIAMIMDWIFRLTCFIIRFRREKWRLKSGL